MNHLKLNKQNIVIPYITGDGIGAEIMPAMQAIVNQAVKNIYDQERSITWKELLAGEHAMQLTGSPLPPETIKAISEARIAIKGPLTTPVGGGIRSLNVALRQGLDLYVCMRPVRWFASIGSPVKHPENVNMVVFRENTEDIYAGIEWEACSPEAKKLYEFLHDEMGVTTKIRFPETSGFGIKPVSISGTRRLVKAAGQYAIEHHINHVTLVHKGNIMKFTEGAFKKWGYEVLAENYGESLHVDDCICDAFLQNALIKPEAYDVIATTNLNGDYISDMLAAQVGGIGISPGANINFETGHALFEATHGTAPDIAGKNVANPCSLLLSATMMLDYLGWTEVATRITKALEHLFSQGYATPDLARFMEKGHALSTREFTIAMCEEVAQ